MSRARDLARLGNENIISVDSNNNVGINSTVPEAQLDVVGVISATTFTGNVTGTVTGDATGLTGTPDIVVNNITGVAATFTGELTYEDVTSIDSIGVVTARSGVVVSSGSSIGIGTDDPNKDFHIESTIPSIVLEESDAAADNKVWTWKADSEELVWQAETDTYTPGSNLFKMTRANQQINTFEGHNSGTAWFVVDNANERVGIGTDSPSGKIHVRRDGTGSVIQVWSSDLGTNNRNVTFNSPDTDSATEPFYWSTGNSFAWEVDGAEEMRIEASGDVGIGTDSPTEKLSVAGNVKVQNSADASQYLNISYQGIDFQNTGAGSSTTATSHLLDDYEEGAWTPGIEGVSTAGSYTFTGDGAYTKVGNKVTVWGQLINITTVSAGSGNARVTGLPFVSALGFDAMGSILLDQWDLSPTTYVDVVASISSGVNHMNPRIVRDSNIDISLGITAKTNDDADIKFCITYTVA